MSGDSMITNKIVKIKSSCNKTFYQRTLLGMSANQKRHYLKSYNNFF